MIPDSIFSKVIGLEGGYVFDPDDPGGETQYGISKRAYPEVDIKNLTLSQARAIYERDYWQPLKLDNVAVAVAGEVFEQAVNLGVSQAIRHLQRALVMLGVPVAVDGVMGPATLDGAIRLGIRADDREALINCLNGLQFQFYCDLVERKPEQRKFFKGWLKRVGSKYAWES